MYKNVRKSEEFKVEKKWKEENKKKYIFKQKKIKNYIFKKEEIQNKTRKIINQWRGFEIIERKNIKKNITKKNKINVICVIKKEKKKKL